MWGTVRDKDLFLKKAIRFTGDHKSYGEWMFRVVKAWKFSCEHNLSNLTQNRLAWIGHAACAIKMGCPEDLVRKAWWALSEDQRILANIEAKKAVLWWEENKWPKNI